MEASCEEPVEARSFEDRATSDLCEELTLALGERTEGVRVRWSGVIEAVDAETKNETVGAVSAPILLLAIGSSDAALRSEHSVILQRVRAAAASAAPAPDEPDIENTDVKLTGSERANASEQQMLALQAQQIAQLEAEKRELVEEIERLRRGPTGPRIPPANRIEESVPPVGAAGAAGAVRGSVDPVDATNLTARSEKQLAELKDLLQRSLAQLDRPVRHLPAAIE